VISLNEKEYLPIPSCPNWFINKEGKIYSDYVGRELKPYISGSSYLQINRQYVDNDGKRKKKKFYVHRLVAETFLGEIPKNMVVNHKDGNKLNNHVSNLEIVTSKENNDHAKANCLLNIKGSSHGKSKLNEQQVLKIKQMFIDGYSDKEIASIYDVSRGTINPIRRNKTWKHVVLEGGFIE